MQNNCVKFTEKFPLINEFILVACRNKNKDDGIWLFDVCYY